MGINDYGFQSHEVSKSIALLNEKIASCDKIVLAFTGNIISSGLRTLICELTRKNKVNAIVTSGAGLEEDLIKTFGYYLESSFDEKSACLIRANMHRIGNLSVPSELYDEFYKFLDENYCKIVQDCKCDQTPGEIGKFLANIKNDNTSFLYWAHKNNISVFCPTFHDGAFGDFFVHYRERFENYRIDFLLENVKLTRLLQSFKRCGIIIIGGGTSKHFALNNSILRGGYDWSITITTAIPFDGSDSGGNEEEAKTWHKLRESSDNVRVYADATLVLPMILNNTFFKTLN